MKNMIITTTPPWASSVIEVLDSLNVTSEIGLSSLEAEHRIKKYGLNTLKAQEKITPLYRFLSQLKNPVIITLLVAVFISGLLGETLDACVIAAIVILNAIVGYAEEAKAEAAIEELKKLSSPHAKVLRDGNIVKLTSSEVCGGDIILLESGDYVPADCRIVLANQLSTNESILTGESFPVNKDVDPTNINAIVADRINMLFASTTIVTGTAKAVITATGMNTEVGKIAQILATTKPLKTPLQNRLEQVSKNLLVLCSIVIVIVAILGLVNKEPWFDVLMTAISLAVAAIPEGLPTVVTLALAIAIRRMAKRSAIVKHLPAVETLGATDVICTDKTGTLTTGKMQVREVFTLGHGILQASKLDNDELGDIQKIIVCSVLCSNASLSGKEEIGDPTEIALLNFAKDKNTIHKELVINNPRLAEWSFDSDRKRMSVAVNMGDKIIAYCKGAPELLVELCKLDKYDKQKILSAVETLSAKGRRVLAFAERLIDESPRSFNPSNYKSASLIEDNMTFLGLIAIADSPREESIEAIKMCKAAGIKVVMITGDHPITAKSIATELGIIEDGKFDRVLTGIELEKMSDTELSRQVEQTAVYARVSPAHKVKIVQAWQDKNNIVAMTGDGVNDAPALKQSSIGISMGKGGTEVARQASSMILMDDNFKTIVSAIEEGRAIYGNIRRTIQYLLSTNITEVLVMLGAVLLGMPSPLAPIHLLWINLVTDGPPALALAAEPVPKNVLTYTKRPSPTTFFDKNFYKETAFVCIVMTSLALGIYIYSRKFFDETSAKTNVFFFLVFAELFRSFACRSEQKSIFQIGFRSNMYHLLAVIIPSLFQLTLNYVPLLTDIFKITRLSIYDYIVIIILALLPVTFIEIKKLA